MSFRSFLRLQAPSRRNWLRLPLMATFISVAIGCLARPGSGDAPLRWAPAQVHTDFTIVDPDEDVAPDPLAPRAARKYDTFAHQVLDIDAGEALVAPERYALLDTIIDQVKARLGKEAGALKDADAATAREVLDTIDDVLTEQNFLYPPGDYDVVSLRSALAPQHFKTDELDRLLRVDINKRRRAHARDHAAGPFYIVDCDISSFIYVGVGDALGANLRLVDLPDHMFVRWEFADGTHLNWDTNDAEVVPDQEYAADYDLGKRLRKQRVYLSSMTRQEGEGFAYYLRATRFEERDENDKAIADLEKARSLYPQSTQAKSELAWLYATADGVEPAKRKAAIELAQSAVDLEPACGDFWDSLAAAHAANGDFKRAVKYASKAEKLAENPDARADYTDRRKAYESGRMPSPRREADTQKQQ